MSSRTILYAAVLLPLPPTTRLILRVFTKFALRSTNTELSDILLGHVLFCTLTRKIPKFLLFDSHTFLKSYYLPRSPNFLKKNSDNGRLVRCLRGKVSSRTSLYVKIFLAARNASSCTILRCFWLCGRLIQNWRHQFVANPKKRGRGGPRSCYPYSWCSNRNCS